MSRAGLFGAVLLVFAWLSSLAPARGAADDKPLPSGRTSFRIYGADDGLSNLVTRHLAQDRLRFVWVGTDDGLFRYDGERFVRFGLDEGLPSTRVTGLLAAPDGRLWMASRNGLAFLDETDITKPPPRRLTTVMADRGPSGVVLCLAAEAPSDRDGPSRLWVGTSDGLFREDIAGSARFVPVPAVGNAEVSALWIDADHKVLMGRGNKLEALNTSGALDEPTKTLNNRIDKIVRDRLGRLWLRTPDGLYVQRAPGQPFVDESARLPAISTNGYLALDRKGDVWTMTNRGLLHIDGDRYEKMPRGLPTEWSWSFLEDHEGSRWIGSTGLNRELGRGLWRSYGVPEGFASEIIWELQRDRDGSMLVATDEGVARLTATGAQRIVTGTERYTIRAITLAPDGSYYAAGSPAEVLHIQPSGKIEKLGAAQGLRGKTVMAMFLDGERRLWIGTDGGGLQRMDTKLAKPVVEAIALPGGTDRELINDLRADAAGRLWVAAENGLALVAGEHKQRFTLGDGLRATGINTVLHRKDGDICISYFDSIGMSCFREENGKLTGMRHRDVERGLSSNRVYSIGEDARGRLWVTSGAGADVLTGETLEHFGKSDGMPGDDCDSRSFLADPDGGVWIGTSTGLGRFDGAHYEGPIAAPQTTVIAASAGARPLRTLPLQLGPTERTLALYITGSSYTHERRTTFESRLVGLDDDWTLSATRELRFPGLAPGRYLFEVRSRVDRGAWGEIAAWPVIVEPAWWQTWIARAAGLLLFVAFFALAIGWRLRRLRLRNEQLQTLVEARTAELKVANQALTDQTLTDPLTGLRNRRYLTSTLPTDVAQVQRTYRDLTSGRMERLPRNVDLVFLMVDLDHFKQVNDQHGHSAGDRVLQELRGVLIQACRTSDIVVRWGGEEFLIVARNSSRDEATILAERVRAAIAAHTFDLGGGKTLRRTCSVGFAAFPLVPSAPDAASWEEVIDLADRCLYLAKREGRDRWVGVRATEALVVSDERSWLHQQFDGLVTRGDLELQRSEPKPDRRESKPERREPEPV